MSVSLRRTLLATLLLISVWLSWHTHQRSEEDVVITKHSATSSAMGSSESFQLKPRVFKTANVNLFEALTQPVIQRKAPALLEEPFVAPPQAPPLPFKFIGRWKNQHGSGVFIDLAGEVLSVERNQKISPDYLVMEIKETVSDTEIVFLYLPLNEKQSMHIGKNKS